MLEGALNSFVRKFVAWPRIFRGFIPRHHSDAANKSKSLSRSFLCPICRREFPSAHVLTLHHSRRHIKTILHLLRQKPVQTYTEIFGQPLKKKNSHELRFGSGLVVTVSPGPHYGLWYDFTGNVGGGPIGAIKRQRGVPFLEAVEIAAKMTGLSMEELERTKAPEESELHHQLEQGEFEAKNCTSTHTTRSSAESSEERIKMASEIWDERTPLEHTIGSKYLTYHRGILPEAVERLCFGFLPKQALFADEDEEVAPRRNPALLVPVRNADWDLTGVQRIFLDEKTGGKPKYSKQNKFSKGVLKGSCGVVQYFKGSSTVFVVEGPETGAAVACAATDSTVLATLSLGNLCNSADVIKAQGANRVVLALDNDENAAAKAASERAVAYLTNELKEAGIKVEVRVPVTQKSKTGVDWNDVLRDDGIEELKRQLD